jgi:hypothetical protein
MREGRRLLAITQLLELPLFIALSTLCARLLEHRFVPSIAPTMQCTPHVYCICSLLYYSFLSHQLFTRGFAYSSPGASLDEPSTLRLSRKENMKKPNHTENSVRFFALPCASTGARGGPAEGGDQKQRSAGAGQRFEGVETERGPGGRGRDRPRLRRAHEAAGAGPEEEGGGARTGEEDRKAE